MINLVKAELLRLVSRRMVWAVLIGLAVLTVIQCLSSASTVAPLTEQDYADAQEWYEQELEWYEEYRIDCEEGGPDCGYVWDPVSASADDYLRTPYSFHDLVQFQINSGIYILLFAAAFMAVLVTGADFGNGALATQLTFTPRRGAVFVAKTISGVVCGMALALGVVLVGVITSVLVFVALRPLADLVVPSELVVDGGRFLLTVLVCVLGVTLLSMLVGNIVGTLGVGGCATVLSFILESEVWNKPAVLRLLPSSNLQALMVGEYRWWQVISADGDGVERLLIDFPQAAIYFAIVLAVILAVAFWQFRRRDVLI